MFNFIPPKILARVFGHKPEPPAVPSTTLAGWLDRFMPFMNVASPGKLDPAERRRLRGYLFKEGHLLILMMINALRNNPQAFPEIEDPLALADQLQENQRCAVEWGRLAEFHRMNLQGCEDYRIRHMSSAVRAVLAILEYDRQISGPHTRRRPKWLRAPQPHPDREFAMAIVRSIFNDWQERLRGRRGKRR